MVLEYLKVKKREYLKSFSEAVILQKWKPMEAGWDYIWQKQLSNLPEGRSGLKVRSIRERHSGLRYRYQGRRQRKVKYQ